MASSLFVNALQVEFESVLAMEHTGMARMFQTLVDTGHEGFLAASDSIYEAAVIELFANAIVIAEPLIEGELESSVVSSTGEHGKQAKKQSQGFAVQETQVEKKNKTASSKKKKAEEPAVGQKKKKEKAKKVVKQQLVKDEGQTASTKSTSGTSSDEDSCMLAGLKEHRAKRKSLIMYKLYEMEVQKSIDEHLENFKSTEPSVNYDYMCIRFLSKELREIARQHRDLRVLAGLPIVAPEASIAGDAASTDTLQITLSTLAQPRIPALEFYTQDDQEQAAARKVAHPEVQIQIVNEVVENRGYRECTVSGQSASMRFYIDSNPRSSANSASSDSPSTTRILVNNLQMVVYNESREERIDFLDSENNEDSFHDGSQQVFVSCPPATIHADITLEAVEKVVVSLDSCMGSMDSKVQAIDSRVKSMDSRLRSLDSKVEQLLNIQTFMKHDFVIYKHGFYDRMEKHTPEESIEDASGCSRTLRCCGWMFGDEGCDDTLHFCLLVEDAPGSSRPLDDGTTFIIVSTEDEPGWTPPFGAALVVLLTIIGYPGGSDIPGGTDERFVSGNSEQILLHLPFFLNGKVSTRRFDLYNPSYKPTPATSSCENS
ncbi:hypothetical protein F511_35653 [Dorcoceras hygrometricum]|uniref:Uncharacterized protein n=1 Tax=Dorcoceras hygrometricum TaxID=472368 RepID=A0A2Z7BLN8_9LAMI|nr:hypothetical protein F511_35653 [Dorcoceras hygrometricum]